MLARILLSLVLSGLFGCGGNPRAPVEDRFAQSSQPSHTVQQGDTLYSIAFRYGLDYRKVAAANGIDTLYRIYPGQRIILKEAEVTQVVPAPAALPTQRSSPAYTPAPASPGPVATPVASPGWLRRNVLRGTISKHRVCPVRRRPDSSSQLLSKPREAVSCSVSARAAHAAISVEFAAPFHFQIRRANIAVDIGSDTLTWNRLEVCCFNKFQLLFLCRFHDGG